MKIGWVKREEKADKNNKIIEGRQECVNQVERPNDGPNSKAFREVVIFD